MGFVDLGVIFISAVLIFLSAYTFKKKELDRVEGAILILIEVAYMWYLIANI